MSATPDLSGAIQVLNAISSVAVIVGAIFIIIQLRQNNRLITASKIQAETNVLQTKSGIALSMAEQFTSDSFTGRRKAIREIIGKYVKSDWKDFLNSSEDFEVRAFGRFYEMAAHLARLNLVDRETLEGGMGYTLTFDWEAFAPAAEYYRKAFKVQYVYHNFQWLAEQTARYLEKKEVELNTSKQKEILTEKGQ